MPTSTFIPEQLNSIDFLPSPTGSPVPDVFNLGLYFLGGSKSMWRRPIIDWNLYGAPLEGRPLNAADIITQADIIIDAQSITGGSGFASTVERITRTDWSEPEARWDRYRIGLNWTTAGGDVDAATPAAVPFVSPITVPAEFTIPDMLGFVEDAIANRAGVVRARLRKVDESVATSFFFTAIDIRLRVAYVSPEPRPMMLPARDRRGANGALVAQPSRPSQPSRPATPTRPHSTLHALPCSRAPSRLTASGTEWARRRAYTPHSTL